MRVVVDSREVRDLAGRFERLPERAAEAVAVGVREATALIHRQATENIYRLFRPSGRMPNALKMSFERFVNNAMGSVSITGVGYVTQEFGGTRPYDIFPVNARALRFVSPTRIGFSGGPRTLQPVEVFARRVHHPPLPERSYLRAAMAQKRGEIRALFGDAIRETFRP